MKPFVSCLAGSKVALKSHAVLTSSTFYMTSLLFSLEAFTVSSLTWHFEISNSQNLAVGLLSPPAGALTRPGDRDLAASLLSPHLTLSALGRSALILFPSVFFPVVHLLIFCSTSWDISLISFSNSSTELFISAFTFLTSKISSMHSECPPFQGFPWPLYCLL